MRAHEHHGSASRATSGGVGGRLRRSGTCEGDALVGASSIKADDGAPSSSLNARSRGLTTRECNTDSARDRRYRMLRRLTDYERPLDLFAELRRQMDQVWEDFEPGSRAQFQTLRLRDAGESIVVEADLP